jgi:hypothetical protein
VSPNTLGKGKLFAECQYSGHSRKGKSLPSVTRWALGTGSVAVTTTFFVEYLVTLDNVFAECPIKVLGKEVVSSSETHKTAVSDGPGLREAVASHPII